MPSLREKWRAYQIQVGNENLTAEATTRQAADDAAADALAAETSARAAAVAAKADPVQSYATGSRPSAATAGVGKQIYDTTLHLPLWSNGTVWKDAAGNTV
jgi:hypothetical protein